MLNLQKPDFYNWLVEDHWEILLTSIIKLKVLLVCPFPEKATNPKVKIMLERLHNLEAAAIDTRNDMLNIYNPM